jgi:hypothetical protein
MVSNKIRRKKLWRKRLPLIAQGFALACVLAIIILSLRWAAAKQDYEITDDLGGVIFPSAILSVATTDTVVIQPSTLPYLGNPKNNIAVRLKANRHGSRVRITLDATPFFRQSVTEFILPKKGTEYTLYPDVAWNYDALRKNLQPEPVSVVTHVEIDGKNLGEHLRTFSVRGINDCPIGYVDKQGRYHSTNIFFLAYINEDSPLIDGILREALNTGIVNRFMGYQSRNPEMVDRQVYAIWNVLQKRHFRYSSISQSSLSSNVVYAQRVRTMEDAMRSSQINCVDGSVLFASLLKAININPILVCSPGHMFVGYFNDHARTDTTFLETTMIGDVNLDDFFPEEKLDSTNVGKSQNAVSLIAFQKSKEYAKDKFRSYKQMFRKEPQKYFYLEISRSVRQKIQSIGK